MVVLAAASLVSCTPTAELRVAPAAVESLLPNDRGTVFADAANGDNALLGISLNDPHSFHWPQMSEASVKVSHGLVHLIRPSSESQWPYFPYAVFTAYEQGEVTAGRPPLRLTATYQGSSRPVYLSWSLGFPQLGQLPPMADENAWEQAVNIADDRYVTWLVDNYVEPTMLEQYFTADGQPTNSDAPYPNEWLGMDEIVINYHLYGVLDDAGNWVPMDAGPVMDPPFPDGSAAFHAMYQQFFRRLHEIRSDLRFMVNPGSPDDWAYFAKDFADVDGLLVEDVFGAAGRAGADRALLLAQWSAVAGFAADGGVVLARSLLAPGSPTYDTDLRSHLMGYLMLSGTNTAWAPQATGFTELPPAEYQAVETALGRTVSPLQVHREDDGRGALFTRMTERGIAYVNATGHDAAVTCPAGVTCRDRSGVVVDGITLPNLTGDYLLTSG
jgi:hypothetical protein